MANSLISCAHRLLTSEPDFTDYTIRESTYKGSTMFGRCEYGYFFLNTKGNVLSFGGIVWICWLLCIVVLKKERPDDRSPRRPTLTMKKFTFFICKHTIYYNPSSVGSYVSKHVVHLFHDLNYPVINLQPNSCNYHWCILWSQKQLASGFPDHFLCC